MPKLPDFPGKDFVEGTTKRARAVVVGAGSGALAVGGFVVKRVLGHGDDGKRPESGVATAPREAEGAAASGVTDGVPPVVPTGEGRRTATKRQTGPKPKAAKSVKPKADKPKPSKDAKPKPAKPKAAKSPKVDPDEPPATTGTDAPTVPGVEPGDQRGGKDPHHALNNPVTEPDETEYPDPYDKREDSRDPVDPDDAPFGAQPHPPTGAESTSEPPPTQDPEGGDRARPPRRENLDK